MADNMIRIGADVSRVETGVAKATKSSHSLTVSVEQGGRRISAGMKPAADGAAAAAAGFEAADKRVERSLKSMERAIQRDIAMKEAGERGTRRYYEALAAPDGGVESVFVAVGQGERQGTGRRHFDCAV